MGWGGDTVVKEEIAMQQIQVHDGQCGLCTHFGESHPDDQQLVQIRTKHTAPDDYVDSCGLPHNAAVDLKVTPISGCSAFEPALQA